MILRRIAQDGYIKQTYEPTMNKITDTDIEQYLTGESLQIEYKEDRSGQFSDSKIYESAIALANIMYNF